LTCVRHVARIARQLKSGLSRVAEGPASPLRELAVGDAELALGVIDYENDSARIDELVAAAGSAGRPFSVATECGMARLGERGEAVTLQELLEQHARVAAAIR